MSGKKLAMAIVLPAAMMGCSFNGDGSPQVLGPQAFYDARPSADPDDRRESVDTGGAIVHNPPILEEPQPAVPTAQLTRISPSVARAAEAAMAEPGGGIIASGSTTLPSGTTGQYLTGGGVVVRVGGVPIYADKVIRVLTPVLAQDAKDLDMRAYRIKVQKEIGDQVGKMVRDELYYSTAMQNLTAQDIQMARAATGEYRKRQITSAGGSEEQARARARAEGIEFDEKVNDEYRVNVWRVYLQKKIYPLVQVTADDIRKYYTEHQAEFTEHEQVQVRVIKITAEASGPTPSVAMDKAKGVRERLASASADEFAKVAGEVNDDRGLKASGGRIGGADGWMRKGSFAVKEVEDAAWALQVGQVTDVIQVGNAFYIARLDDRKTGKTASFDDMTVQASIKEKLRQPQIMARQNLLEQRLLREAVIEPAQPQLEPVLEMAMQKYGEWRGEKK